MRSARIVPLCLFCGLAWAQIYPGGYPPTYPGGYPPTYPGGYPPGYPGQYPYPGSGVPIPSGRRSTQTKPSDAPMPIFHGSLKRMDDKTITLATDDHREIDFKRTSKTKFLKDNQEAKPDIFKPGDQISIEAPEDASGYLTAVNVYWEQGASPPPESGANADKKEDQASGTWTSRPAAPATADGNPPPATADVNPPPAKPDPDDPGPPVLRRGKPDDPAHLESKPVPETAPAAASAPPADLPVLIKRSETAENGNPPAAPSVRPVPRGDEDLPFGSVQSDPVIRKATDAALDFTETLPNYVCQEMIARFQSETSPANWQPLDVVSTEVVYQDGKEDYRNVTVDGRPTNKPIEESGGAWSTGEFGSMLISLFAPATAAQFHYLRDSRVSGITAREYSFTVARENSNWTVKIASQSYRPAYIGTVWIDPATDRALRIEMQAQGFPADFPTDHVESATDYGYVRLGDARQFLLPVHSETLSCQRSSSLCAKNQIDFRNYRKFEGESTITFGEPKP